jgi:hypothetical protein
MSNAASQALAFYREVAEKRVVWTIRDDGGYPAPKTPSGKRAQPFWSSVARAERIIRDVRAYAGFRTVEISWEEFSTKWVSGLTRDGILAGVNWSGARATGYDLEPENLKRNVDAAILSSKGSA